MDTASAEDGRQVFVWDSELRGFGLRVAPKGTKSFIVQYRHNGKEGRYTLGRYGVLSVDAARDQARQLLAAVARGEDPKHMRPKQEPTIEDLAREFKKVHVDIKKATTAEQYNGLIERYILPKLKHLRVSEVTRADVARLHQSMRDTPYAANRMLAVLSKMFNMAEVWGYRDEQTNPCRLVSRYQESGRRRYLSGDEFQRLEAELRKREAAEPSVVRAVRLLLLTGARVGEILTLEWKHVDFDRRVLTLPDSKTGAKEIRLAMPAVDVLKKVPEAERDGWVIPGRFEGTHLAGMRHQWERIRTDAKLQNVRLHDLRHTFASVGASQGLGLPTLGGLLGHTQAATTQRYVHLYQDHLTAAADQIGEAVSAAMAPREGDEEGA